MKNRWINLLIITALAYALCFCDTVASAQGGYQVTHTKINFYYSKTVSFHSTVTNGTTYDVLFGQSISEPTLTDADGNITITGGHNTIPGAPNNIPTAQLPVSYGGAMGIGLAKSQLTLASFTKMVTEDKSLNGGGMHNASYSGGGGSNLEITVETKASSFYFRYDAVTGMSAISMAAQLTIFSVSQSGEGGPAKSSKSDLSIAFSNAVMPAIIAGNTPQPASIVISKTPTGFSITYSKNSRTENTTTTETLNATIGEPISIYEAVIQPYNCDYQHWLPAGPNVNGSDDNKGDLKLRFNIVVRQKADHTKLYSGTGAISWVLADVTHYAGFCNNYPAYTTDNPDVSADIVFNIAAGNPPSPYSLVNAANNAGSRNNSCTDMIANIMCMDYAAWGKLTALVRLQDGTVLTAISSLNPNKTYMTIPFDDNENKIADEWENTFNTAKHDLKWDADSKPENQRDDGDGYTLFEEYRGFAVHDPAAIDATKQDTLARTNPDMKDAFIYDPDGLFKAYYEHDNPSRLAWHYVKKYQIAFLDDNKADTKHRWVNFNKEDQYSYANQYAVVLLKNLGSNPCSYGQSATSKAAAVTFGFVEYRACNNLPASPADDQFKSPVKNHIETVIYVGTIQAAIAGVPADQEAHILDVQTGVNVRHELGHYLGIQHHSTTSADKGGTIWQNSMDGATDCVMRYPQPDEAGDAAFLAMPFKDYCKRFATGFLNMPVTFADANGDLVLNSNGTARHRNKATPRICDDNCFGQITVKSAP